MFLLLHSTVNGTGGSVIHHRCLHSIMKRPGIQYLDICIDISVTDRWITCDFNCNLGGAGGR